MSPLLAIGQPVITEFMASNESTLTDENGDYSDWIEIHNPTSAPINLEGWHLTDRENQPTMWTFPATTLEPNGYLVVFASSKNRRTPGQNLHTNFSLSAGGEYLGLIAPDGVTIGTHFSPSYPPHAADVSYGQSLPSEWVSLLSQGSSGKVLVPTNGSLGDTWRETGFDDAAWTSGTMGVGFDRNISGGDEVNFLPYIETNVEAQMFNQRTSFYARVPFTVTDPTEVLGMELRTYYDDGFVAYLNGGAGPLDQINAPAVPTWNSGATATVFNASGIPLRVTDVSSRIPDLVAGQNVLAVQGLNVNLTSSDLMMTPELRVRVPSSAPSRLGFFVQPTPGAPNAGNEGLMLAETVVFSQGSGTFTGTISVTLSGAAEGQVIRYTVDGSIPTASSDIYTAPLSRSSTTLLRAKIFDASGASGQSSTVHYQRLSSALAARKSNLPMLILDARGQGLNDTTRLPGYFQLFDKNESGVSSLTDAPTIATRQGIRWRGSSSLSQPKKPYAVEFWDETGESVRIPVLGMTEESDWVLYAPYDFDRSYTRNSIMYELSRKMGRWAPNTRFVEVFFNANGGDLVESHYSGVYAIIEQIKMNSRRLGHSVIEPSQVPPPGPINYLAEGNWTGGYLFKIDRPDSDEYNWHTNRSFPTFVGGTNNAFVLNRPKLPNLDGGPYANSNAARLGSRQVAYIQGYTQQFEDALAADQSSSFSTRNYLQYIERGSWVDHLLLCSFAKNVDALRLSAFFHKPANQKLSAGPLWDFDRSLDSYDGRDNDPNSWYGGGDATRYFEYDLWGMLSSDPDFAQAYYDRWAELRQTIFSNENLALLINSMGDEIENSGNGLGSAAARDAARWSQNTPRGGAYANETAHIRNWAIARANWMDRRMFSGAELPAPPELSVSGNTVTLSGSGTIYYSIDSDPRASGAAIAGTQYSAPFQVVGNVEVTARTRSTAGLWSTPVSYSFNFDPVPAVFVPTVTADWTNNANWTTDPAPYPNAPGVHAEVGAPATGDRNVELRAPVTIGSLTMPQGAAVGRNRVRDQGTGNGLTFDGGSENAKLDIGGTGAGYVEFEVVAGVALQSDLEVNISNIIGHAEYGALRAKDVWNGPGGFIKKGPGVASFTSEPKLYAGATRIEEGVLRVTGPSAMANSSSVEVLDGGQLRLISSSSPGQLRIHTFGGDLFLEGHGRGAEIPEASAQGKRGALRYDPGTTGNHAIVTNPVEMTGDGGIHVDGPTNLLELNGGLRGAGQIEKSGGGTLSILGDNSSYSAAMQVVTGGIHLRGNVGSAVTVGEGTRFDVGGSAGSISGSGSLILPATALNTPSLDGMTRAMVFKATGMPTLSDFMNSGNALAITGSAGTPVASDYYIDLSEPVTATTQVRGGYLLPRGAAWASLLDAPTRIFIADAAGIHNFNGRTWTLNTDATVAPVPVSLSLNDETLTGRMLEIRFDGGSVTYESWKNAFFSPEQAADPGISGPTATPFGDGVANLIRYALGITGSEALSEKLPVVQKTETGVNFSLPYDPRLRGIRWQVQVSEDLADWTSADVLFDSNEDLVLPMENGRITIPDETTSARRFYRLQISEDATR